METRASVAPQYTACKSFLVFYVIAPCKLGDRCSGSKHTANQNVELILV